MRIFLIYSLIFLYLLFSRLEEFLKIEKRPYFPIDKKADECCCPIVKLQTTNDKIYPILEKLTSTYFFKIFRINLEKDCAFWVKQKICTSSSCVLCKCDENEIPAKWAKTDLIIKEDNLEKLHGWTDKPNSFEEFIVETKDNQEMGTYINLEKNPESYTGYQGKNIWPAIYKENCFGENGRELCHEEKMFNKLVSGLHASINSHIFEYIFDPETKESTPNYEVYFERVGNHPDRIENLFFVYSVMLRAINVAADFVHEFDINTGFDESEDENTEQYLQNLLNYTQKNCDFPFREDEFFADVTKRDIKLQIEKYLNNITQIMDCVECEKCRVHGTLQIYGLGAAFKILFSDNRKMELIYLKRNEFISLVVTFSKFSKALKIMEWMWERRYHAFLIKTGYTFGGYFAGCFLMYLLGNFIRKRCEKFLRRVTRPKKIQ